jgi:hypothetical protein
MCIAVATVVVAGAASAGGLACVAVRTYVAPTAATSDTIKLAKEAEE